MFKNKDINYFILPKMMCFDCRPVECSIIFSIQLNCFEGKFVCNFLMIPNNKKKRNKKKITTHVETI